MRLDWTTVLSVDLATGDRHREFVPHLSPAPDGECECGRPIADDAAHDRWVAERDEWRAAGGVDKEFNPLWDRALCWMTKRESRCPMRKRWASDQHVGEARAVMRSYMRTTGAGASPGHYRALIEAVFGESPRWWWNRAARFTADVDDEG